MVSSSTIARSLFRKGLCAKQGFIFVFTLVVLSISFPSSVVQAASCNSIVGKWMWFIGGEVTVNRDGTFTQQSGNTGTWECNDGTQGRFTFRWRDGGFVNSLAVSPDGQGLTSLDQSQWYVTARRTGSAPIPQPPLVRKQDPAPIPQPPPVQKPDPGRTGSAPSPQPPLVREENCCQEAYACEVKKIEAGFERKSAECRGQGGNALCFKAAVSTKASGLQAAGEKLRLCNRADNPGVMPPGRTTGNQAPSGGLGTRDLPPPPSSSDEFHSTEQTDDPCHCITWPDQVMGDVFDSDSPGADQGSPPSSGDVFDSDCPADYSNRDIPGASDEARYALGFSQAVRQCLAEQVTIENLAIAAFALRYQRVANFLRIVATPGAIDAVLRPSGSLPESNPYRRGKAEATRLCEWGLKVSPVLVARCPATRTPVKAPGPQVPPRQPLAQLLSDLSWLRKMNPTGNQYNCGNTVLAVWQAFRGRPPLPAPPMSCAGTTTSQLESIVGGEFGPPGGPPEIHNSIFLAGEGAHGIVYAKGPPPLGETRNLGHYFNIVRWAGEVYLLDGQLGRAVSWAEYLRMGFNEFRLLRTN